MIGLRYICPAPSPPPLAGLAGPVYTYINPQRTCQDVSKLISPGWIIQERKYLVNVFFQHNDASVVNISIDWLPILNQKQLHYNQP